MRPVLLALLLAALALGACGSSGGSGTRESAADTPAYDDPKGTDRPSSGRPDRREYATTIDEICSDFIGGLTGISISTPGAQERLRLAARSLRNGVREIAAERRPRGKAGREARRLVRLLRADVRFANPIFRDLGSALRRGDAQSVYAVLKRVRADPYTRDIRRTARALGATSCAD